MRGTVQELQENSYIQCFLGLREFQMEPLFDPSMMVHFRKRFPVEEVAESTNIVGFGPVSVYSGFCSDSAYRFPLRITY